MAKNALDSLEDAPSKNSALDSLEDATPTPTGLPNINKSTDVQPSPIEKAVNAGVNAIPGLGAGKQLFESLNKASPAARRTVTQAGGMMAGAEVAAPEVAALAAAGSAAPEVAGPAIGLSMAGAGAGNVVGGLINDLHDDPKGAMEAISMLFDPAGANLQDLMRRDPEEAKKIAIQKFGGRFTEGAIGQLLSLGLSSLVPSVGGALDIGSKAIPGAEEALRAQGYSPDAAQYTTSRIAKVVKTVAEQGMLGADTMAARAAGNEAVAAKNLDDTTTALAGGLKQQLAPSELAKIITSAKGELAEPLQKEIANTLYKHADDVISGPAENYFKPDPTDPSKMIPVNVRPNNVLVPTNGLKQIAADMSGQSKAINNLPSAFSDNIKTALSSIIGMPDSVSFADAHYARSVLLDSVRNSNNGTLVTLAKRGSAALDDAMSIAAKSATPEGYQAWRNADKFFKAGKDTFNNDLVSKLFLQDNTQAEKVGRTLMSNGNTSQVKSLLNVFNRIDDLANDPKNSVQLEKVLAQATPEMRSYVADLKDRGINIADDLRNKLKAGTLQDMMAGYTTPNPDKPTQYDVNYGGVLNEFDPKTNPEGYAKAKLLYGDKGVADLKNTLVNADRATHVNSKAFDTAIRWSERILGGVVGGGVGAAVGHPGVGFMTGEAAGLFGVPKIASYLMTDPIASKYFTNGVQILAKNGTAAAIKTGTDMIVKAATAWADNNFVNPQKDQQ